MHCSRGEIRAAGDAVLVARVARSQCLQLFKPRSVAESSALERETWERFAECDAMQGWQRQPLVETD